MDIINETRQVFTSSSDMTLSTIREQFAEGDIIAQPDYQRDYVMDDNQASKLIESILMGIPIPTVYLCEEQDSSLSIIDGQQRLTSIVRYLNNDFELKGLQELTELNHLKFKHLDKNIQKKLKASTIHTITLLKQSEYLKYEIFARLNQGSVALKPQELRNCIYRGNFNNMLNDIAKNNNILKILFISENNRSSYQENILRFFALRDFQKYSSSIKKTLNNYMNLHKNDEAKEIEEAKKLFTKTIDIIKQVLGEEAFCSYERESQSIQKKFSGSVYDSIIIPFSMFNNHDLIQHADKIRESINKMKISDIEYQDYTYAATGSKNRVVGRIMKVYNLLAKITGKNIDTGEKRIFDKELKEKLFHKGYICSYCNNEILSIDDAEVDHVLAYSNGGDTIEENAQLLHRHCNREKSDNEQDFEE